MITFVHKGDFSKTKKYFNKLLSVAQLSKFDQFGRKGVEALRRATPKDSGKTADSWYYEIDNRPGRTAITWKNSNVVKNVPIAVILQYGHGTRNGGYVQGRDYINPAIKPVFDEIAKYAWEEVRSL